MRSNRSLLSFWVVAVMLCGSAVAQLSSLVEITASENTQFLCTDNNGDPTSECSGSYSFISGNQFIDFAGSGSTAAGYGPIKAENYSSIHNYGDKTISVATALAVSQASSYDTLNIYGLKDGETAYLSGFFPVSTAPTGNGTWPFSYSLTIQQAGNVYSCAVTGTNPPNCSLKILITYSDGQPVPMELFRVLTSNAISSLAPKAPNGAAVLTGIQITANTSFKVVNAKGATIPGVTVVGVSGYIYN